MPARSFGFIGNSPLLTPAALAAISDTTADLIVPTMGLVEIKYLMAKRRINVSLSQVEHALLGAANVTVHQLDKQAVSMIPTGLNIHDAIITATALVYRDIVKMPTTLITKDSEITQSGLIQTLW